MKEKTYNLKLFTNAMGPAREKSRFTYLNFYGQTVDIPYIIWRIEGADKNILSMRAAVLAIITGLLRGDVRKGLWRAARNSKMFRM